MPEPRFIIRKGRLEDYYFSLQTEEGEVLLNSSNYFTREHCESDILELKQTALEVGKYRLNETNTAAHFFALCNMNGETIAKSPVFNDKLSREEAVERTRSIASKAIIEFELN